MMKAFKSRARAGRPFDGPNSCPDASRCPAGTAITKGARPAPIDDGPFESSATTTATTTGHSVSQTVARQAERARTDDGGLFEFTGTTAGAPDVAVVGRFGFGNHAWGHEPGDDRSSPPVASSADADRRIQPTCPSTESAIASTIVRKIQSGVQFRLVLKYSKLFYLFDCVYLISE